jgi:hypothetical protein
VIGVGATVRRSRSAWCGVDRDHHITAVPRPSVDVPPRRSPSAAEHESSPQQAALLLHGGGRRTGGVPEGAGGPGRVAVPASARMSSWPLDHRRTVDGATV